MGHRSAEILKRLPLGHIVGAEIGVFDGKTSAKLLERSDLTLFMVDPWTEFVADGVVIADAAAQEANHRNAVDITDFAGKRRHVVEMESLDAAPCIEDHALDFVFIDGDHSFAAVCADLIIWERKVKQGGLLCGHDYNNPDYNFGKEVKRAVDEYAANKNLTLDLGGDYTWFLTL